MFKDNGFELSTDGMKHFFSLIDVDGSGTITFEEWCRHKEMMQRLKDRLILDAKFEILEQRRDKEMNDTRQTQNWEAVRQWCHAKDKERKLKKNRQKKQAMIKKMNEINKRKNASKGFKEWLKISLMKAKQENHYKKQVKKLKKKEKAQKKKLEERKQVEAEITFKKWKQKKDREKRQEQKIKKYEEQRAKEELRMLKEKRRLLNQGADVMLAYSLNKNIKELENLRKRPKSARMGLRI